ncbi:DUF350 domain-containing protein [Dethiothermospora halolimnae]|uniref:DUF350 domain-containing protein n=1 Tax=Dethiothermospora halolimnae TaxID=3114390 RepID=UPI003CCC1341
MLTEALSIIVYFVIGMALCTVGYKFFDLITPFDLQKEIDDHNMGAGLAIGGMFIGIAILIGGIILP